MPESTNSYVPNAHPRHLSVDAALKLFDLKLEPIACYGIEHVWPALTCTSLRALDSVKAAYLKRTLGVSRLTRSRLIYLMTDTQPLSVDLFKTGQFDRTEAYTRHVEELNRKQIEVPVDFFGTPAMTTETWKESHSDTRHAITRYSSHGFHHIICKTKHFREASEQCICKQCEETHIGVYHLLNCSTRTRGLMFYAKLNRS